MAFLLSSARLATSLRLMSQAEIKLKRDDEAEQTLLTAIRVFGRPHIKTCLNSMYSEEEDATESGQSAYVTTCQ